ncbi:hypothetical protein LLG96_18515, partial [bacterium]|nr:hypothetical protein [bacterium]
TFSNFGENLQLAVAIVNPYSCKSRQLPDFVTTEGGVMIDGIDIPICDRDTDDSKFDRVGVSARLGWKNKMLNVGVDAYMSDPKEGVTGAKSRYGVDGELKMENGLLIQGQFTMAQTVNVKIYDGTVEDLDHFGAEGLVGWEKDKIGLYARYGMMSYDDKLQDVNSIMLSAVYKIHPRIHLRLEGLINGETEDAKKGWAEADNNVLFFETLFAW